MLDGACRRRAAMTTTPAKAQRAMVAGSGTVDSDELITWAPKEAAELRGVLPGKGLGERLGRGGAECRCRADHHRPVRELGIDVIARLVVVFRNTEREHQLMRDIVCDDPFELIDRLGRRSDSYR